MRDTLRPQREALIGLLLLEQRIFTVWANQGNLTIETVHWLESKGYVETRHDLADGWLQLRLTARGRELAERVLRRRTSRAV